MDLKLKKNASEILSHKFECQKHGYDCYEVDTFLDDVCSDYVAMEQEIKKDQKQIEVLQEKLDKSESENHDLDVENQRLNGKISELELQYAVLSQKFKDVPDGVDVSMANIDLLKRISNLEQALYKLGKDPSKI